MQIVFAKVILRRDFNATHLEEERQKNKIL